MPDKREPVKNTCPDIDRIIGTIKSIITQMKSCNEDMSTKEILSYIDDWSDDLASIGKEKRSQLEDLRDANEKLRDWGNAWMEESCSFEDLLSKATDEIEELKEQIKELENENI